MRAQAVGVPQFTETFETSTTWGGKGTAGEDDFASVLHQTAGDTVPAPANATGIARGTPDPEELASSEKQNTQSHSKQLQATTSQVLVPQGTALKRNAIPGMSTHLSGVQGKMASLTAGKVVEGSSSAVSEESLVGKTDDLAAPTNRASTIAPRELPQPPSATASIQERSPENLPGAQTNEVTTPASRVGESGRPAKLTTVDRQDRSAKHGVLQTNALSSKSTVDHQATTGVTNGIASDLSLGKATNDAALQAAVPQNATIASAANLTGSGVSHTEKDANKTTSSVGQIPIARRAEGVANRKAGAKIADETATATEPDAPLDVQAETEAEPCVVKDVSEDASKASALLSVGVGSFAHSVLASDVVSASGGHGTEIRAASAMLVAQGPTAEGALSSPTTQLQASATSGDVLPHTMLGSSATSLEVGVASGTHGWLKIRAEMTGSGEVNASLTGGSSIAANRLRDDLPALSSYLQAEKVQVSGLNVHTTLPGAAPAIISSDRSTYDGSSSFSGGADGGGAGGRPQQQDEQGTTSSVVSIRNEDGREVLLDRASDLTAFRNELGLDGKASLSSVEYGTGGGWLNVRA
jgi:hypothetical protein